MIPPGFWIGVVATIVAEFAVIGAIATFVVWIDVTTPRSGPP